jgi:phosphoribosylanthranilate isomerase
MMVKICGITRREDALAAAEYGASAIGFILYPNSPRYVSPEKARELSDGLALLKVGVFVDESPASVESVMRAAKLDVAQIYGPLPERYSTRMWQAVRVPASGAIEFTPSYGEAIVLDGASNGICFDWEFAKLFSGQDQPAGKPAKVIIAGGLDSSNVAEAIRIAQPWGVDASSSMESSPGIKNHEKIRQFIKAAQGAAIGALAREKS